jgi:hypothetical protein
VSSFIRFSRLGWNKSSVSWKRLLNRRRHPLGISTGRRDYCWILHALQEKKALTKDEHKDWTNARKFRNLTTHAERQTILMPGQVVGTLTSITEAINRLFE